MDDLVILFILLGFFSLALVVVEGLAILWRTLRQRMWFPRHKGGRWQ